jgi:hypothetical protein
MAASRISRHIHDSITRSGCSLRDESPRPLGDVAATDGGLTFRILLPMGLDPLSPVSLCGVHVGSAAAAIHGQVRAISDALGATKRLDDARNSTFTCHHGRMTQHAACVTHDRGHDADLRSPAGTAPRAHQHIARPGGACLCKAPSNPRFDLAPRHATRGCRQSPSRVDPGGAPACCFDPRGEVDHPHRSPAAHRTSPLG